MEEELPYRRSLRRLECGYTWSTPRYDEWEEPDDFLWYPSTMAREEEEEE